MLTGKDYPHLCSECQAAIDYAAMFFGEDGPDTDNEEAPCDFVYDHRMFCGGHTCINRPEKATDGLAT